MNKPQLKGLTQLDTAVLLQKMIVLNGMLNYGSPEEIEKAKKELKFMETDIQKSINLAALQQAKYELNISDEELGSALPFRLL
jgi:hypothetical protein